MRKSFLALTAAALMAAVPAMAATNTPEGNTPGRNAPDMDAYYDNTLVVTGEADGPRYFYIDRDGTWTEVSSAGPVAHGQWTVVGSEVCFVQVGPQPVSVVDPYCTPMDVRAAGDEWQYETDAGVMQRVVLQGGREFESNLPGRKQPE